MKSKFIQREFSLFTIDNYKNIDLLAVLPRDIVLSNEVIDFLYERILKVTDIESCIKDKKEKRDESDENVERESEKKQFCIVLQNKITKFVYDIYTYPSNKNIYLQNQNEFNIEYRIQSISKKEDNNIKVFICIINHAGYPIYYPLIIWSNEYSRIINLKIEILIQLKRIKLFNELDLNQNNVNFFTNIYSTSDFFPVKGENLDKSKNEKRIKDLLQRSVFNLIVEIPIKINQI